MSQQPPSIDQIYRQFQQASTTQGNIIEMLIDTCTKQATEIVQLRAQVVELTPKPQKKK
jgi:flagellin-specific chaperone FliS